MPRKKIIHLNKASPKDPTCSHKSIETVPCSGGAAKMKTVLSCTQEQNFQGFGGSRFGPFRQPLKNLCQTTPNTNKNAKIKPQQGIHFCACRVLESPFGPLDSEGGLEIAFSCVRVPTKHQNSTKWKPTDKKYPQYPPINIETDTVLTTLWTPAQTNLRMPLHEFIQRPRAPKRFLWAAW